MKSHASRVREAFSKPGFKARIIFRSSLESVNQLPRHHSLLVINGPSIFLVLSVVSKRLNFGPPVLKQCWQLTNSDWGWMTESSSAVIGSVYICSGGYLGGKNLELCRLEIWRTTWIRLIPRIATEHQETGNMSLLTSRARLALPQITWLMSFVSAEIPRSNGCTVYMYCCTEIDRCLYGIMLTVYSIAQIW